MFKYWHYNNWMPPKRRSYPKQVVINGELWDVKFKRKIDKHNSLGETDCSTFTISIKTGQTASETFSTFLHEVLHVAEFAYDFELPHHLIYKLEEALTSVLEEFEK